MGIMFVLIATFLLLGFETHAQSNDKWKESAFLRGIADLDEPRGLCVDIPGHKARVNVTRRMVVHSCKWGIWNLDERFDQTQLTKGHLKMPEYNLCLGVPKAEDGSEIFLSACDNNELRNWSHEGDKLRLKANAKLCLTIGPEPSELTPGGRRLPSKHVARSLWLSTCSSAADARQKWQFINPVKN